MNTALLSLLLSLPFLAFPQSELPIDSILDKRDGRVYETIKIGQLHWLKDFLHYETDSSFCPNFNKKHSSCDHGNYYSYKELSSICPAGWRIPNEKEWNDYFVHRLRDKSGSLSDVEIDTLYGEFLTISYRDTKNQVALFGADNPLGFQGWGWIEGSRKKNKQTATIWVKHTKIADDRFHLHIANESYILHTHEHHIDDVPKKSRKFMVKCVSESHP